MSQYNKIMKDTGGKPELEPRCMIQGNERRQQAAVTNRGHLIPCCWIDQTEELKHPTMQKILAVSKISEVESIDEILLSLVDAILTASFMLTETSLETPASLIVTPLKISANSIVSLL